MLNMGGPLKGTQSTADRKKKESEIDHSVGIEHLTKQAKQANPDIAADQFLYTLFISVHTVSIIKADFSPRHQPKFILNLPVGRKSLSTRTVPQAETLQLPKCWRFHQKGPFIEIMQRDLLVINLMHCFF